MEEINEMKIKIQQINEQLRFLVNQNGDCNQDLVNSRKREFTESVNIIL